MSSVSENNDPNGKSTRYVYKAKCAVENCGSKGGKKDGVSFHSFPQAGECFVIVRNMFDVPEKMDKFKAWQQATKISLVQKHTKVCSLHFKKEDYFFFGNDFMVHFIEMATQRRRLKKTAVPTCNLPGNNPGTAKNIARAERVKNRAMRKDGKPWMPTKSSTICSTHFVGGEKSNNPLNVAFNPTIFPECYGKKTPYNNERAERAELRSKKKTESDGPSAEDRETQSGSAPRQSLPTQPKKTTRKPYQREKRPPRLENDAENWIEYKLIGTRLTMKRDVVPHLNIGVNEIDIDASQISPSDKKLKDKNRTALRLSMMNRTRLRIDYKQPNTTHLASPSGKFYRKILPALSATPREYEVHTLKNNPNQELNKQFEFVSCASVSTNENAAESKNIKAEIKMIEDNITIKDEFIGFEDIANQEININTKIDIKEELDDSLISSEKQQIEEMLPDDITIKDEFIESAENPDQEIKINTNFVNIKVEPADSFISSEKQAQEILQDNIKIKEECIGLEESVDQHDSLSILPEKRHTEEITIKEEPIDTVD